MTRIMILCALLGPFFSTLSSGAERYPDRWVWVFGYNLGKGGDLAEVSKLIETAGKSGLNGAVLSAGLDTLCKKTPDFFAQLDEVKKACDRAGLELIPSVFSVGYGSAALSHNRNLAEGLPVENAPFLVKNNEARLVPDESVRIANGGFEEPGGKKIKGFTFCDQVGEVSILDTQVKHSGQTSMRLENFTANPHGHGRVTQDVRVQPHRCYRVSMWVKTENLVPAKAFRILALAKNREIAPRQYDLPETTDWRQLTMVFNSLEFESVRIYAGMWGGRSGKLWLDDWSIEELGPLNMLNRPGTPLTVLSEDGATTFAEGQDFARPAERLNFHDLTRNPQPLKILPNSRIKDGQRVKVSWYHALAINDGQVTACMGEPELYEIFDHEAKLLAEHLHPKRVLLNMDEIRMGGTCKACAGRPMDELLSECITKQVQILRRHMPGVEVYIWSDMLDPNHNAHGSYYLVQGDFTGSWKHVPKDLIIAIWGGPPRDKSLQFFAQGGFRSLVACYYDADNLDNVKGWLQSAQGVPNVRGFMYTPWQKKYALLPQFGELLK